MHGVQGVGAPVRVPGGEVGALRRREAARVVHVRAADPQALLVRVRVRVRLGG